MLCVLPITEEVALKRKNTMADAWRLLNEETASTEVRLGPLMRSG
jgi:hypothetical protein